MNINKKAFEITKIDLFLHIFLCYREHFRVNKYSTLFFKFIIIKEIEIIKTVWRKGMYERGHYTW
jgi:hypothetical protein